MKIFVPEQNSVKFTSDVSVRTVDVNTEMRETLNERSLLWSYGVWHHVVS